MPAVEEELSSLEVSGAASTGLFRRYLFWLAALLSVVYLAGFLLVRIPSYERWGGSAWGPILDYAFQLDGENADVLIFGDSSALFAVDTMQMSQQLGLKVINLPNTIGGLPVIGDMALQQYLQRNRPPRLIVFYFSPWNLDFQNAKGTRLFEGEEMLVRHAPWSQIFRFAVHHPREVFYFPFRVYSGLGPSALAHALHPSAMQPEVFTSRGHVDNHLPYPPLGGECDIPASDIQEARAASGTTSRITSLDRLIAKYARAEIPTMTYFAPVPGCKNVASLLKSVSKQWSGAPPVFSASDFNADSYYAHLKPDAVAAATRLATAAVRAQLGAAQSGGSRGGAQQ